MGSSHIDAVPRSSHLVPARQPYQVTVRLPRDRGQLVQHSAAGPPSANPPTSPPGVPGPGDVLRWRKVFLARFDQAMPASDFIAGLVVQRPDRREITSGTAGLAVTAIGHATRAGHGHFVIGLDWSGPVIHVIAAPVSDAGLVTGPVLRAHFTPGPETLWHSPLSGLPLRAQTAELTRRFPAWHIWFGPQTREWWAIPRNESSGDRLISAPTADVLASRLRRESPRERQPMKA